jgi:hypothetical protein
MYGLINKAVYGLVSEKFGLDAWNRIRTRAGLPDEPFLSMEQYPDEVTFSLVAAATVELGIAGSTFPEFVKNIDHLHSRVRLSFPHLQPPSFTVSDEGANSITVHYYSTRQGLAPLVIGLFDGLGERFNLKLDITHEPCVGETRAHEILRISWRDTSVEAA